MNFFPINRDILMDFSSGYNIDYTADIRDLKIKIISGEYDFSISNDMVSKYKNQLEFISDNLSDDVITGSLVLNLFGLINRDIKDIDVIISKKKSKDATKVSYRIGNRYGMREEETSNRLGYLDFRYKKSTGLLDFFKIKKKYTVDFFEGDDVSYIEFYFQGKTLKLQNPCDIILQKSKMGTKHLNDVNKIFNSINFPK